jgi:hypothetical protein
MPSIFIYLHDGKTGAALAIRVTPMSSRSEIAEIRVMERQYIKSPFIIKN